MRALDKGIKALSFVFFGVNRHVILFYGAVSLRDFSVKALDPLSICQVFASLFFTPITLNFLFIYYLYLIILLNIFKLLLKNKN